jgi:hypothetical protein
MKDSKGNEIKVCDVLKNPDDKWNSGITVTIAHSKHGWFRYRLPRTGIFCMTKQEMNKSKWVKVGI